MHALQYVHWLILLALVFFVAERLRPERRQRQLRPGLVDDVLFVAFNGHFFGLLRAWIGIDLLRLAAVALAPLLADARVGEGWLLPMHPAGQFVVVLLVLDLVKWLTHRLLHGVPFLWKFHQVHHAITTLDWLGNWRFHWFEVFIYQLTTAVPLLLLIRGGAGNSVLLAYYVVETAVGNLNHANVRLDFGPLRYVINSPRMHIWHHECLEPGRPTRNFGVVLSLWDWLFGTAHVPPRPPARLGFDGSESLPRGFFPLLVWPFARRSMKSRSAEGGGPS